MEEERYIGFVSYEGDLVKDGLMDARKQAQALLGFDFAVRYFVVKYAPDFRGFDFEIPVRVKKGSWEALIPETIGGWMQAGLGVVATAYFSQAAQKMAEKDFADVGVVDIFQKSLEMIKWFLKVGKHMGSSSVRKFEHPKFSDDNDFVGIKNESGEYLYVPRAALELYATTSPALIEKLAQNIEVGRELKVGTFQGGVVDAVVVTASEKWIFCDDISEDDGEILFPELAHGDVVVLDGEVTRENKTTNSMGFKYKDHILTAYPQSGSIVQYKQILFLKCRMHATVSRLDEDGNLAARRPKLYFTRIDPLQVNTEQDLFS